MISSRRVRRLVPLVLLLLASIVLAAIVLLRPPTWWSPLPRDEARAIDVGERFEQGCLSELHRVRADNRPWAVRARASDVNAWLATRLPKWCEHAGVSGVGAVQVRFTEGAIQIAADVRSLPGITVATLAPDIVDGELTTGEVRVALGRLPVPFAVDLIIGELTSVFSGDDAPDELRAILPLLRGQRAPATFELSDGRRVVVRDVEIHSGEILIEFETVGPAASAAH